MMALMLMHRSSSSLGCTRFASVGHRFNLYLCLFLLVLDLFSVFHLQTGAALVNATEDKEYSVASILTNINTLWFWRSGNSDDANAAEPINEKEHVSYEISDIVPPDKILIESVPVIHHHHHTSASDSKVKAPVEFIGKTFLTTKQSNADDTIDTNKHNTHSSSPLNHKNNRICHSCNKNAIIADYDEEYRQRIEYIKQRILSRIGLKEPPRIQSYPEFDYVEYMRIAENTLNLRDLTDFEQRPGRSVYDNDPIEDVEKVFIMPAKRDRNAPLFDLSNVNTSDNSKVVKSIHVMVNYNLTEYYYLTLVHDDTDLLIASAPRDRNTISNEFEFVSTVSPNPQFQPNNDEDQSSRNRHNRRKNDDPVNHWYQYEVTSLLGDYTDKIIRIHNENFDILNSVVVIEMTNSKFLRSKRSIDCSENVSFCCRQHFYVNFTTIGWNNWILQPPGYNANYCTGKCDLSNARYNHTTVIGKYPAINMCCSPREMSSISLIYMDQRRNINLKKLTDMTVESCDCA